MSKTDKPHYIVRGEEVPAEEITFVDEDGYKDQRERFNRKLRFQVGE